MGEANVQPEVEPPDYPPGGELIFRFAWRYGYALHCNPGETPPAPFSDGLAPLISVFANPAGYRWLSDFFRWLAERPPVFGPDDGDPGNHIHLRDTSAPCNYALSDETDWTFDTITDENREVLLSAPGMAPEARLRGSPLHMFAAFLRQMAGSGSPLPYLEPGPAMREIADLQLAAAELMVALAARAKGGE